MNKIVTIKYITCGNMRIRKVQNKREFENVIDEFITIGYTLQSRGEDNAKLKKKEYGGLIAHILIALFTIWWTLGIVNIIYAYYKYKKGDEVLVKLDDEKYE